MKKKNPDPIANLEPLEIPTKMCKLRAGTQVTPPGILETLKTNIVQNALQTQIKIKEAEIDKSDPKNRLDHLLIRYTKLILAIEDKIKKSKNKA